MNFSLKSSMNNELMNKNYCYHAWEIKEKEGENKREREEGSENAMQERSKGEGHEREPFLHMRESFLHTWESERGMRERERERERRDNATIEEERVKKGRKGWRQVTRGKRNDGDGDKFSPLCMKVKGEGGASIERGEKEERECGGAHARERERVHSIRE